MIVSADPDYWEPIATHPRVFPNISARGIGWIDIKAHWGSCLGLQFPGGGFIAQPMGNGVWNIHVMFVPGNWHVRRCASEAGHYLFTRTDCVEVVICIPSDLPRSIRLANDMKFKHRRTILNAWPRDTHDVSLHIMGLTKSEWENA